MIKRLNIKNNIDIYEFLQNTKDTFEDFYIVEKNERKFLVDWSLINKTLSSQEIYGIFNIKLEGILMILKEKGFRTYIKILASSYKYNSDLLKFLKWNFKEIDLYMRLKKENKLGEQIKKSGFIVVGNRDKELLFFKKGIKEIYKITPKDDYLPTEEKRLY